MDRGRRPVLRDGLRAIALAARAQPVAMAGTAALAVATGIVPTASAWVSRLVINGLVERRLSTGATLGLASVLAVAGALAALFNHVQRYVDDGRRRDLGLFTLDRLFRALGRFTGLRRFETPSFVDQIRLAQENGGAAPGRLVNAMFSGIRAVITGVGFCAVLMVISPVLTLIVVCSALPAVVAQLALGGQRAALQMKITPGLRRQIFYRGLQTDLNAAKEVRLFGLADFLRQRMLDELRAINRDQRALERRALLTQGALAMLSATVVGCGLLWTVAQTASGQLTVGDVSLFVMAAAGTQAALATLVVNLADAHEAALLFGHFQRVVSAGPDLPVASAPAPVPPLRHGIEVRDVWFRYDQGHPWVLRGVSMHIPFGASVALIGLNGAGKSTLVKLLARLYDPDRGAILWDGQDIRDFSPDELRQRFGTVFQDYMAYDLTAADNVGIGDLARIDDRSTIGWAAGAAGIHEYLSGLPNGYDTMLSRVFFDNADKANPRTGVVPSGGQWQRLALARGLMRHDRDLLILDEPSAGLDAQAEHEMHSQLVRLRGGKTSLLISHRLNAVRDADRIFVLSGGQIIEQGTHGELIAARGEYQRLFQLQASGYQDEPGERQRDRAIPVHRRARGFLGVGQDGAGV